MEKQVYTFFIAGGSELAIRALSNFDRLIRPLVDGECLVTVIDVIKEPRQAREHRVIATPLLVREHPSPVIKILGDLSQEAKVLAQLGLSRRDAESAASESNREDK